MSSKKAALLAAYGMLAATAIPQEREVYELENPYADLPPLQYTGGDKIERKTQLTNKQQKKRAAAKRAKKARKKNR
jgi:hypothetical protein